MSKRQAPDSDQQGQHGRNGKLRKRGPNVPSADENVEIIDVEDGEEEEDWFNMTMSKHTHTWQDDSQSSRLRTYSARSARAERRKNIQDQQNELIADEELFDTQLQKALALSKQEAEKSTFQQQAEEEELQKILERSRVDMGTPVRASQVETAADVFLSPGQTEPGTPARPARIKAPTQAMQVEKIAPVKPPQVETTTGAPVQPAQVETCAPVRPTNGKTAAPAKLAQVKTASNAPARATQVETGSPVRGTQLEETGEPVKPAKLKTNGKTCKKKAPVETEESAPVRREKKVETAAGAAVIRAELEIGTPAKPSQSKAGADTSPRCNSHGHVEAHRTKKQLQGKAEEEKVKKHQAKVKRRRQISLDYMESGTGERWIKKRRVVYHHGNFVRRPGVDTAKQTKYIIKCLENYRLRLYQAQRQQLSKLDWGKPLEAEDDTKPRSRRRKGTWTAVSQEEDADNSQPADQDTQNGALATLDKDNKDGTIDLGTFEFDNDTQNGTVSSAVESQGQTCDNVMEPAENSAETEKMEKLEMPDSTSFDIDILDLPSPEHKPLTRSQSRETSSPVMDTPDQAKSLETEEETQITSLPDKTADERTGPSEHEQENITIPESQEHTIQDHDEHSTRRTLRPRSTKQLKITDVVLTDESEKSDNDVEDGDFLQRIQRRLNLKRKPLHRQGRNAAPVLKQGRIDHAVRNGTEAGSTSTSRTEPSRNERVMQSCFICGKEVPEDELQEHINNELDNST